MNTRRLVSYPKRQTVAFSFFAMMILCIFQVEAFDTPSVVIQPADVVHKCCDRATFITFGKGKTLSWVSPVIPSSFGFGSSVEYLESNYILTQRFIPTHDKALNNTWCQAVYAGGIEKYHPRVYSRAARLTITLPELQPVERPYNATRLELQWTNPELSFFPENTDPDYSYTFTMNGESSTLNKPQKIFAEELPVCEVLKAVVVPHVLLRPINDFGAWQSRNRLYSVTGPAANLTFISAAGHYVINNIVGVQTPEQNQVQVTLDLFEYDTDVLQRCQQTLLVKYNNETFIDNLAADNETEATREFNIDLGHQTGLIDVRVSVLNQLGEPVDRLSTTLKFTVDEETSSFVLTPTPSLDSSMETSEVKMTTEQTVPPSITVSQMKPEATLLPTVSPMNTNSAGTLEISLVTAVAAVVLQLLFL